MERKTLKFVHEGYYSHMDIATGLLFTFKEIRRGIEGRGTAWCFKAHFHNNEIHIATFSTRDDMHGSSREDYQGRIWKPSAALIEAENMMNNFIKNCN